MADYPERTVVTLPEPYLTAIGRVCVQWAMLEQTMEKALIKLGALDDEDWRPLSFTAHMTWPQRMNLLETLIDGLIEANPHLSRYKPEVAPALNRAQAGRNKIVHAFWGYDEKKNTAEILSVTARGKFKTQIDPMSTQRINTIADDIGLAAMLLWKVLLNRLPAGAR